MISIICLSNNKEKFEKYVKKSLSIQSFKDYELICVDTEKEKCRNATEALKLGTKLANNDIIMFLHNDIVFQNKYDLENIVNWTNKIGNFGIIGVAGTKFENEKTIGNIYHGVPTKRLVSQQQINEAIEVQSLDECLFIIKKKTLDKYPFDESNDTWHLYSVDYSLYMNKIGEKVLVIPSQIYHVSAGNSMNNDYYKQLIKICKKYKKTYKNINTPMGYWSTNNLKLFFQIIKSKIKIFYLRRRKEI